MSLDDFNLRWPVITCDCLDLCRVPLPTLRWAETGERRCRCSSVYYGSKSLPHRSPPEIFPGRVPQTPLEPLSA